MSIYENCPELCDDAYRIRLIEPRDTGDLLGVYGDRLTLPFFNSDNCHGANFYCRTLHDVQESIKYWLIEYHENHAFVRFAVESLETGTVIGTLEMLRRTADDFYDDCGILRIDLGTAYESTPVIEDLLNLVSVPFMRLFGCSRIDLRGGTPCGARQCRVCGEDTAAHRARWHALLRLLGVRLMHM